MVYTLTDTSKVAHLFEGWEETMITSCLQKVMGTIYVTDLEKPKSAMAFVGCFALYAGEPDEELVLHRPSPVMVMLPRDEKWAKLIVECFPWADRKVRYAIKKDTVFDKEKLMKNLEMLPEGYEVRAIDSELYDLCLEDNDSRDFVSSFDSKEQYLELGRGMVILKDGKIVAGASSYSRYREGIEIEVDTVPEERKKGLATIACSALILRCLEEGLYPSWDAANLISVHLSENLGYEFSHEYIAYYVIGVTFAGISRTFSTEGSQQFDTIGAFWDEMSEKYGRENLWGLGYNWTENTIEYVIGLKDGEISGVNCRVDLPGQKWTTVQGKTDDLGRIYDKIYQDGSLTYEIEMFNDEGDCIIKYYRA